MRKVNKSQKTLMIFPIVILLGVIFLLITPKGPLLKALSDSSLVEVYSISDKKEQDELMETDKNEAQIRIVAKETGFYKIEKRPEYSIDSIDHKGEQLTVPILTKDSYSSYEKDVVDDGSVSSTSPEDETSEEVVKPPSFAQITVDGKLRSYYLYMEKGESQYLSIERKTSEDVSIKLQTMEDDKKGQTIVAFKNSTVNEVKSSESSISTETFPPSGKVSSSIPLEPSNSTSITKKTNSSTSKERDTKDKTKANGDQTKDSEKEENSETNESKEEAIENPSAKDPLEIEEGKKAKIGSPKSYERILFVETKKTSKSVEELNKINFKEDDSLTKPLFISETSSKQTRNSDEDVPIIIRDAKIDIKTGTSKFDNDNNAGNDKDEKNDIVRTFDQISYTASFSIQNTKKNVTYTDIRYRVIARMPNAVEMDNAAPRNNGEFANGIYIDDEKNNGNQYSEGVMESVISDSGQVFVPIILNVYGSTQGKIIQPSFEIEIVEAKNAKTGEIETFNKRYDETMLSQLKVKATTVSAKPSIGVRLTQGQVLDSSVFGVKNQYMDAYDVGVTTVLQELSGRDKGDYKGSTFPTGEISYKIKQGATYQIGSNAAQTMPSNAFTPVQMSAYAQAANDRSSANWKKIGTVDATKFTKPLDIPTGKTGKIYTHIPNANFENIGVFDSGEFNVTNNTSSQRTIDVKNSAYKGVLNPYTYNMTGVRTPSATSKSFSSLEIICQWDKTKTINTALANKWTQYKMSLNVDEVSYDGFTTPNNSTITFPNIVSPAGTYWGCVSALVPTTASGPSEAYEMNGRFWGNATPGTQIRQVYNAGQLKFSAGQEVYFTNYSASGNIDQVKGENRLLMWDSSAFKYDKERDAIYNLWSTKNRAYNFKYGVVKKTVKNEGTPPYTMKVQKINADKALYDWYDSPDEAEKNGEISALYGAARYDHDPEVTSYIGTWMVAPVIVTANPGSKTPKGNPIVVLGSSEMVKRDGSTIYEGPFEITGNPNDMKAGAAGYYTNKKGYGTYVPTEWDNSGNPTKIGMDYWNFIGDSAYVKNMAITTKTDVIKNLYQTNEDIDIHVTGLMTGSSDIKYDASLTTTLPKGIYYDENEGSKDGQGNVLDKPKIVSNADGTTTLKWTFKEVKDITKGLDVFFKAKSDVKQLKFQESGYTSSLVVKTIGEMWVSGKPDIKDESNEGFRSSTDEFIEMLIQQLILSKTGSKPAIELGDSDPLGTIDNTITYKIKMVNNSLAAIPEAKLLDVLPYNGDSRGSKLSGNYTVEGISINEATATINYTNTSMNEKTDPNSITGWSNYISGTTPATTIKNAKAILVTIPSLEVGEEIELTVKVRPTNQKAGDVFVNDASMNSKLNMPVESQAVWTRVYGRELSGVAWYDDNLDGLIGNKKTGGAEDFAKDIPVKLYRTTLSDKNYKDKLVETSLTGEKFVDASGNSLIKTDKAGKYTFAALPEGTYVAEFVIGDRVERKEFHVTKQLAGSDPTKNSKADLKTYRTPGYKAPLLEDLNRIENVDSPTYKIENVNLGLIRPATLRLFKFETGSAIDANGDGKLSNEEKATGKPLKGATFEIYKKGETTAIATADTDANGYLMFEYLYKGSYQLKETKAPEGYELIKEPIDVEVVEGNQNIALFASDDKSTQLPFTGANKWVFGLLIGAAITMIAGFGGITYYYRQPKKKGE